jgi:hypothetical protein
MKIRISYRKAKANTAMIAGLCVMQRDILQTTQCGSVQMSVSKASENVAIVMALGLSL